MTSKQLVEHVLVTQSPLQDDIILAMFRQGLVDPAKSLIITLRGPSTLTEDIAGCPIVDGDAFGRLRTKRHFYKVLKDNYTYIWRYRSAVVRRLAKGYVVYAAMYSTWFLRDLAEGAGSVRVLEDGIGSYRAWGPWLKTLEDWCPPKGSHVPRSLLHRLSYPTRYRYEQLDMVNYVQSADTYYTVSSLAFPFIEPKRKVVLTSVFPKEQAGQFNGCFIWATSALVEGEILTMEHYLASLRKVIEECSNRKITRIYLKLHPRQRIDSKNYLIYKDFFFEAGNNIEIIELSSSISLERLLSGSDATLLSAISSVMIYGHALGRPVISYRHFFEAITRNNNLLPPDVEVLLDNISQPL